MVERDTWSPMKNSYSNISKGLASCLINVPFKRICRVSTDARWQYLSLAPSVMAGGHQRKRNAGVEPHVLYVLDYVQSRHMILIMLDDPFLGIHRDSVTSISMSWLAGRKCLEWHKKVFEYSENVQSFTSTIHKDGEDMPTASHSGPILSPVLPDPIKMHQRDLVRPSQSRNSSEA